MANDVVLYDQYDRPIDRSALKREEALATVASVRQVQPQHPSWGLSPEGLASILKSSEGPDPSNWYALCDDVEEREWHYRGALGQRRSALAQLQITVDPASDAREHIEDADLIRSIVAQPDFTLTRFDLGDALGKGMAFSEIVWDTSEKQWMPKAIRFRDPTWFRYDQVDLTTPMLVNDHGQPEPLKPYKWIVHRARLKSGIPVRDGLTRAAVWAWMFKNFSIKAWMIFLDRYGMPFRYGTYPASSSKAERAALLSALRNMGIDAAGTFPEGMNVEFAEASTAAGDAFQGNANYLDEQLSKLVLGQTGTTDASKGGYAVGKVHEGVREAFVSYDGIVLATTINRDLVRPIIDLNRGKQKAYPLVKIGLGDAKNVELILKHLASMIDRGMEVEASQVYPLLGMTEPAKKKDVKLLRPLTRPTPGDKPGGSPSPDGSARAADPSGGGDGPQDDDDDVEPETARLSAELPAGDRDSIDVLADELATDPELLAEMRRQIEAAIDESTSFEELKARLDGMASGPASQKLLEKMALAIFNARLGAELGAPIRDEA